MKKMSILIFSVFSILLAGENKVNLKIDGMQCSYSCSGKVTKIVEAMKGVQNCEVDFASGSAVVTFDSKKQKSENIIKALNKKSNFKASVIKNSKNKEQVDSI